MYDHIMLMTEEDTKIKKDEKPASGPVEIIEKSQKLSGDWLTKGVGGKLPSKEQEKKPVEDKPGEDKTSQAQQ